MPAPRLRLVAAALVAVAALPGGRAGAAEPGDAGFTLPSASVRLVDGVYLLDAVARLELPAAVRDALDSGVALTIAWEIEVTRRRDWWLDADVARIVQRYRLEYHELSLQYVVTNLNTGRRRAYTRVGIALDRIGNLIGFPLVDRVLVEPPERYSGHVRVLLEHGTLPLPLRPTALFSPSWHLGTQWRALSFE